jgi:hypothetical protein
MTAKLAMVMLNAPSAVTTSISKTANALPAVLDVMDAVLMVPALNALLVSSWKKARNHANNAQPAAKNALMPPNARPALTLPS